MDATAPLDRVPLLAQVRLADGMGRAARAAPLPALADGVESAARLAAERLVRAQPGKAHRHGAGTVILFALPEESRPFLRDAAGRDDIDVHTSGMGRRNAEAAIASILDQGRPRLLITAGVAGGLNPNLQVGDVVFETSDAAMATRLIALGARRANFAATEHVLVTVADRRRLRERTGGDVVENESGFVQAVCRARGVPCTTIRTISDTADEEMPFDFNKLTGPDGNVDYTKVMLAVAAKPWTLPMILKLWHDSDIATRNLSRFLQQVVPQR